MNVILHLTGSPAFEVPFGNSTQTCGRRDDGVRAAVAQLGGVALALELLLQRLRVERVRLAIHRRVASALGR